MHDTNVAVIGAAGHVGLPYSLVLTDAGYRVFGVDVDMETSARIMAGDMPYVEEGAVPALARALESKSFDIGTSLSVIEECKYVVVLTNTQVGDDASGVQVDVIHSLVADISDHLRPGHVLIIRSTMVPGDTDEIIEYLTKRSKHTGRQVVVANMPERGIQGRIMAEERSLPNIVGAPTMSDYSIVAAFCRSYSDAPCIYTSPVEAELAKLMTNTARYVSFALSNEFATAAAKHGANIHRIVDAANLDYPRQGIAQPGPNVGGPCLYKDACILRDASNLPLLTGAAIRINEGIPEKIATAIWESSSIIRKVVILGMAFKANVGDTRHSMSIPLMEKLLDEGYNVVCVDPHVDGYFPLSEALGADAVVLMTPHKEFENMNDIMAAVQNPQCLYIDMWGFWPDIRYKTNRSSGLQTMVQ